MPLRHEFRSTVGRDATTDAVRAAFDVVEGPGGELTATLESEAWDAVPVRFEIEPDGSAHTQVVLEAEAVLRVPYWGWFMGPLVRRSIRRRLDHAAREIEARIHQTDPPPPPPRSGLAPPVPFTEHQIRTVATICAMTAVAAFGSGLFSANIDFIGNAFDASNRALGVAGAITRVGIMLSLVAAALADRRGRRRLLLVCMAGVCTASGVSALAPNLEVFTASQLVARGFFNATFTVAAVAIVEEAPEGARAYAIALMSLAIGFGGALGIALLPLGDIGPETWRLSFVVNAAALVMIPGLARRLPETSRYSALAARMAPRGRPSELLRPAWRTRFLLLIALGFFLQMFAAPSSQFGNRYLGDERGFTGFDITVFRAVTGLIPGMVGLYVGGKIAESWGRKRTALPGMLVGTGATAFFFLTDGAALWALGTLNLFVAGLVAPALAAFGPELFPTAIRGTANAFLLVAAVLGSASGLLLVGGLSETDLSLGGAVAWLAIAPLLAALFVIPRLPEASKRELDAVSPPLD